MTSFKIKSHAKLNLALNVTGKSSKLHKIESIISFIDLHDLIYLKETSKKKLEYFHTILCCDCNEGMRSPKDSIKKLLKVGDELVHLKMNQKLSQQGK